MGKLNVGIVFAPKAHCKLAGWGIEYVWGIAKVGFRKDNASLDTVSRVQGLDARVKANFYSIKLDIYRACCRKAREYKLFYLNLLREDNGKNQLKLSNIEQMKKTIYRKRCALDQSHGFVQKWQRLKMSLWN